MKKVLTRSLVLAIAVSVCQVARSSTVTGQDNAKLASSYTDRPLPNRPGALRTLEFETSQVTAPDIALTPDGQTLIFSMLGKLFRMPVKGGEAEQLTFGPYFDDNPVVSPDGKTVVFDSDRDGSAGNIFLLDLASREIQQLTRENWADRPVWSPNGNSILYLRLSRNDWKQREAMERPPAEIRRISLDGSNTETVRPQDNITSAFYLTDGRLAWTIVDGVNPNLNTVKTRIESLTSDGSVEVLRNSDFLLDCVQTNSKSGGLYARTQKAHIAQELTLLPTSGADRRVVPLSGEPSCFSLTPEGSAAYIGTRGLIWKVLVPNGRMDALSFKAKVKLEIHSRPPTPAWSPVDPDGNRALRTISQPRMTPDGTKLLFVALQDLWEQPLSGGPARRLTNTSKFGAPFTISPDGREIAFEQWQKEGGVIVVLELATGKQRTVAEPTQCGYEQLSWSPHGELAAATGCDHDLLAIDTRTSSIKVLLKKFSPSWEPWPSISADGKTLYFQAAPSGAKASHYRLDLTKDAKPEEIRPATDNRGTSESAGEYSANSVLNGVGIRISRFSNEKIETFDLKEPDGRQFSIARDGQSLIYVEGNKVWRQPFDRSKRIEIPIRLSLTPPAPPSYLIERARILDLQSGSFSPESSLLVVNGRIRSIGASADQSAPKDVAKINTEGRFVIPGLWDMHGHASDCVGPRQLLNGVTSVRNMGGRLEEESEHADLGDLTDKPIPRCFYSGRDLEGAQGKREDWYFIHPANEDEARMYVRRAKEQGVHFIKLYERLPWPLQRAAADEAHRLGLPVSAHSGSVERVVKGINAGYDGLTHNLPRSEDIQLLVKNAGVHWDPTLGVQGRAILARNEPGRFDPVRHMAPSIWPSNISFPQLSDAALLGRWLERLESVRDAFRRGITVVPGTDSPDMLNGMALQWELEFFEQARIPKIDILRSATLTSAKVMGADGHLGSIESGKLADFLILDADPLVEIKNTQKIWRVFKGGWMFDPKVLSSN